MKFQRVTAAGWAFLVIVAAAAGITRPAAALPTYRAQLDAASNTNDLLCFQFPVGTVNGTTTLVNPGASIQEAIVAAQEGDVISVAPGTFDEDIDFLGKAIRLIGQGPETVIRGTGNGPVIIQEPIPAVM